MSPQDADASVASLSPFVRLSRVLSFDRIIADVWTELEGGFDEVDPGDTCSTSQEAADLGYLVERLWRWPEHQVRGALIEIIAQAVNWIEHIDAQS